MCLSTVGSHTLHIITEMKLHVKKLLKHDRYERLIQTLNTRFTFIMFIEAKLALFKTRL